MINPQHSPLSPATIIERRLHLRARIGRRLRVRTADFNDGDLEQIAETLNVSRQGLYFLTSLAGYYEGMRLRVTLPYEAACVSDAEEFGEVVRVDQRIGPQGVAILLSPPFHTRGTAAQRCKARSLTAAERRLQERFPVVASTEIIDMQTRTLTRARTCDISMSGCYIDTLNPFPVGAILYLSIRKGTESLNACGTVRTQHVGSGMGVVFTGLTEEQYAILKSCLTEAPTDQLFVS